MEVVAKRYAQSLFDLALEENKLDVYTSNVASIYDVFHINPSFVSFFSHVLVADQEKNRILDDSFKGHVENYVLNFLKLLVKKRRMRYIVEICQAFKDLTNEYLGIEEGILYSSNQLSDEEVKAIETAVGQKENKTVHLRVVLDESLVGGIKVQLNNRIIDASIKNKLEVLKKELLRKQV